MMNYFCKFVNESRIMLVRLFSKKGSHKPMSSIQLRKSVSGKNNFANKNWHYDFRELNVVFEEAECKKVANRLLQRYSKITKNWTDKSNSEWTCRFFMASKLIMNATLHINAIYYSEDKNMRVVIPYLRYYTVLSLMRAICYTAPEGDWSDGKIIQMSHSEAIRTTEEHIKKFSKTVAKSFKWQVLELKAERELISYRSPSSGDENITEKNQFLSLCILLAEIAQFNSELFEQSLHKNSDISSAKLLYDYIEKIASVEIEGHYFGDSGDAYRLTYLIRKHPYPANLLHFMTEGHVDDFFGSWADEEEEPDSFNPDELNQIIFDIP